MIAREKDIPYGSKGYPFLGAPCHPVTVSPTCAKKNKGSLSENIDNPLLTSPRVDVIQGNTIALFFLVMAAGGYGRPCERTVTLRGKTAGEGRPGRKMRARAASPFPEPFMQYKETQMNTRGFSLVREERLSEVSGTVKLWRHDATGAELLSIVNNDENKCFGATFRTPPKDSTGVAHILEHSVLCGSEKYPVKEPFVELLKGSLQTFLNAFTFPDKTCYPVASANLQDFYNLVDVYLDAVFFPRIDENCFQQEGWHIEADSPAGPLRYKGVVFNEMKGVYSSPDSVLAEHSQQSLFPDMTYGLDSGGNPEVIPQLTYKAFKSFHESHYHPSNTRFFFWGDDPEEQRFALLEPYLSRFTARETDSAVPLQPRLDVPRQLEFPYASGEDGDKGHVTLNWLTCETADTGELLVLEMLEHILLGLPGSPLRKALIESGLGEDLTGGGLETDLRQTFFSVGLRSITPGTAEDVEMLIMETLAELAENGIPAETDAGQALLQEERADALAQTEQAMSAVTGRKAMVRNAELYDKLDTFSRYSNFDVVFTLAGMMLLVNLLSGTGLFQYVAIRCAKVARGLPIRTMILLVLATAFLSAFLDNVTTILLVAPVTLLVCNELGVPPIPFLMAETMASNIGGTATLIGDPPNLIIGSIAGLNFADFLINLAPFIIVVMAIYCICLWVYYSKRMHVTVEKRALIMELDERAAITDWSNLRRGGIVMVLTIFGFLVHGALGLQPCVVAMAGATLALLSISA